MSNIAKPTVDAARLASAYTVTDTMSVDTVLNNHVLSDSCTVGTGVTNAWMIGGSTSQPNYIGTSAHMPLVPGTGADWALDTGYDGRSAEIGVTSILGGYDNVANQTGGGVVMGNHAFLKYNADGHGLIIGGSQCLIAGGRSSIVGSLTSQIDATSRFGVITGSENCKIQGAISSSVIASRDCTLQGDYSACIVGLANADAATSRYTLFAASRSCTVTGNSEYLIIGGYGSSVATSVYAIVMGLNTAIKHHHTLLRGSDTDTPVPYSDTIGVQLVERNDCRSWKNIGYLRTTNATIANTNGSVILPAGKTTSGLLRITITALQDGSADGDASGNYAVGSWAADIGFRWDGTNGYFYTASGASAVAAGPTQTIAAIRDDIGCAALPQMAISTGLLRCQVSGKAATTINWVIRFEVISSLVS